LDGGEPCDEMTNLADDEGGAMFEEEGHVGHPTINRSNNLLGYSGLCCGTNIAANSRGVDRSIDRSIGPDLDYSREAPSAA
jgi:hypothetical protein